MNIILDKGPFLSPSLAILMLADGCKALRVILKWIKKLWTISKIIHSRQIDGQLDDSNLSKGEIFLIKRSFLNVWKRIRHRRIQYPTSKNNTFS